MATAQLQKRGPKPGTGDFIKAHLAAGEDYIYNAYREFCKYLKNEGQQGPSYTSFRKYWGVCVQMHLIEFVREEPPAPSKKHLFPRRYYRIVKQNIHSLAWQKPQAALDLALGHTLPDPVTGRRVAVRTLGRRRYQRFRDGKLPKPVGRPKNTAGN